MSRRSRLLALVALYAGQYLATGLLFTLPVVLRQQGAPLEQVGMVSLVNFAMIVKLVWAPLVDRHGSRRHGHYRTWLLATQPLVALVLLAMVPLDVRGDFPVLLALTVALGLLTNTQDIATDALAVRLIEPAHRGRANAIQVGAGFFGSICGLAGTLTVHEHFGWGWAVGSLAVLSLLPMAVIVALRGLAEVPGGQERPSWRSVGRLLSRPGVTPWMGAIVPLVWGGVMLPQALLGPLLVDRGWQLDVIGLLTSVLGGAAGIAGAALAGRYAGRVGRARVLAGSVALQALATLGILPLIWSGSWPVAVIVVGVLGIARGVVNTVVFTVSMDLCRPGSAGSDFTLLASWGYAVAILASAAGPALAGAAGYATAAAAAVVLSLGGLACVRFLFVDGSAPGAEPVPAVETGSAQ